ncbi:serine--tRNA synthetase-like protein Slimp [Agrilus planipennis]|uniref:Serine--tRNA synthetase-like protein Slimp n=1 Tax=Agrilus planipennis TaxID=224129 RepID=A0A7F5R3D1_AGRPL|nr:serine--tRNA synthetase-like protein Slimp [Agrilus planipennis]
MMKFPVKELNSNFCKHIFRNFSSALYITGDKAQKNFAVLIPHIDFEERIQNKGELLNNIKVRKLDLDLNNIEKTWKFYKNLLQRKIILDQTRIEIGKEIANLTSNINVEANQEKKLKMHARIIKDDLKTMKEYLYSIEEDAAIKALSLPNILHKKTPISDHEVLHQFLEKPTEKSENHLSIAEKNDLIEFYDPLYYFFKHKCATFEMKILDYFREYMLKNLFTYFSNPDFARSIVVEGCGGDFNNPNESFILESSEDTFVSELNRLHLVGGASLCSFMAYFTRHLIQIGYFPLKYFTCGRKYQPPIQAEASLFTTGQETAIELFVATTDCLEQEDHEIENIIRILRCLYDSLGFHYQLIAVPAHKLKNYECMRISVQMLSCSLQEYVEVAHLSVCDNYLSKRLLCTYIEEKKRKFPRILSGTILSIQKLLGCVIEYNSINKRDLLWHKNI